MWAEGGKYGSIDPCYPVEGRRRRTSTTCCSPQAATKKPLRLHLLPVHHAHADVREGRAWTTTSLPDRRGRAERDARRRSPRRSTSSRARASSTWTRRVTLHRAAPTSRGRCSRRWGERLGVTEDESDFACRRGLRRRCAAVRRGDGGAGRELLETARSARTRSASCCSAGPYHLDPGLNHGVPEEFQVLGYPVLSIRSIPKDPKLAGAVLQGRSRPRLHHDAARRSTTSGRRTTRPTACRRSGRRSSPRAIPTSSCSISRASSAGTMRRPTGSSTASSTPSGTPYSALHDIDANKPGGSIKIRVKTYAHTLKRFEEELADEAAQAERARAARRAKAARAARELARPAARRRARRSARSPGARRSRRRLLSLPRGRQRDRRHRDGRRA